MIAVAWRQHRIQLSSGIAVIAVLAAVLVWTGSQMVSYLHSTGLSACLAAHAGCDTASHLFENRYGGLLRNVAYLNFLPMLAGVFWGAPLVARELETGTHQLAWTQSISRRRWLATKLLMLGLAAAAAAAAFSLLLGWWLHPFAQLGFGGGFARMDLNAFDLQGAAPVAYSLFAFALGTTAGALTRRVLPAMAITFCIYLPVRLWVQSLRSHFLAPLTVRYRAFGTSPRAGMGDWVVQSQIIDRLGHRVTDQAVFSACGVGPGSSKTNVFACLARHGYYQIDSYQPDSRFWTFQGIEASIFLGLAAALLAVAVLWTARR
jgi:hypothetical protein